MEEDDEILLIMAENLGKFIDVVGSVTHATCVLEILEILCSVEETVVRDTAVASICNIVRKLESRVVETQAVPIVQRLKAAEWFTSRISACGLLAVVYGSCKEPELHAALREVFTACCHDETPMVRRAAARVFGDVVSKIGSDMSVLNSDVLPSFKKLCNDESDSVKVRPPPPPPPPPPRRAAPACFPFGLHAHTQHPPPPALGWDLPPR